MGTPKLTPAGVDGEPTAPRGRRFFSTPSRNLTGKSDEALVKLAKQGDEQAIAALYERYSTAILRYCCSILRSQQEAEDIQQEVFLHAIAALRRGPGPISFRPWLYRVAHNACISHLRSRKPTLVVEDSSLPNAAREPETVQREELRQLLDDIGRLSEVQRGALLLREMDGLSYEQIATALDLPLTTVRSTIFRARSTLQGLAEARDADCETIQAELSEIADRRGRRSRRITSHLHVCDECRRFREGLRYRPGAGTGRFERLRNSKVATFIAALMALLAGGVATQQTLDEDGKRSPATAMDKPGDGRTPPREAPKAPADPRREQRPARDSRSARRRVIRIPGRSTVPVPALGPAPATTPPAVRPEQPQERAPRREAGQDESHRGTPPRSRKPGRVAPQRVPVPAPAPQPQIGSPQGDAPAAPQAPGAGPAPPPPVDNGPTTQESPPVSPIHTNNPDAPPAEPGVQPGAEDPAPPPAAGTDPAPGEGGPPAPTTEPIP